MIHVVKGTTLKTDSVLIRSPKNKVENRSAVNALGGILGQKIFRIFDTAVSEIHLSEGKNKKATSVFLRTRVKNNTVRCVATKGSQEEWRFEVSVNGS